MGRPCLFVSHLLDQRIHCPARDFTCCRRDWHCRLCCSRAAQPRDTRQRCSRAATHGRRGGSHPQGRCEAALHVLFTGCSVNCSGLARSLAMGIHHMVGAGSQHRPPVCACLPAPPGLLVWCDPVQTEIIPSLPHASFNPMQVYSFGVTLFEIMERRRPFSGMDGFQIQTQVCPLAHPTSCWAQAQVAAAAAKQQQQGGSIIQPARQPAAAAAARRLLHLTRNHIAAHAVVPGPPIHAAASAGRTGRAGAAGPSHHGHSGGEC